MVKKYKPKPSDTSKVNLSEEVLKLTEELSRNTHKLWANQRINDGWTWGEKRDDEKKQHPCLVPYEELPESEKEYDRTTAMEAIKYIITSGFEIVQKKVETPAELKKRKDGKNIDEIIASFHEISIDNIYGFVSLWQELTDETKSTQPEVYRIVGKKFIELGEPLIAYDILSEGELYFPDDIRIKQLIALTMARSGLIMRALKILKKLHNDGSNDEETLGLLARVHKDLWSNETDESKKTEYLDIACRLYYDAFVDTGGSWTGINAATMKLMRDEVELSHEIAQLVKKDCLDSLEKQGESSYSHWTYATLGEASLILEEYSEAFDWYSKAIEVANRRYGDIKSMRRNARLILNKQNCPGIWNNKIEKCLTIPPVIVFLGGNTNFNCIVGNTHEKSSEEILFNAITEKLKSYGPSIGFSSTYCHVDIIFLEAMDRLKRSTQVVLPYDRDILESDFRLTNQKRHWDKRLEEIINSASNVVVASDVKPDDGNLLAQYVFLLLHGFAEISAKQLETELIPLIVYDEKLDGEQKQIGKIIELLKKYGYSIEVMELKDHIDSKSVLRINKQDDSKSIEKLYSSEMFSTRIMSVLFADAVNFSKLSEKEFPLFVEHFLGMVGRLLDKTEYVLVVRKTWGDGIYLVFSGVQDAGNFALELNAAVTDINWEDYGLPKELSLRIGLHSGPAYSYENPVTHRLDFIGTHICRAARIEPITPPSMVYASQEFAALASAQQIKDFDCEYVGRILLAKKYGTFPTYHVISKKT